MRRSQTFREAAVGDDREQILRYVQQLEDNVSDALRRMDLAGLGRFQVKAPTENAYTAKIGDLVVANATLTLTLPAATQDNAGRAIGLHVRSGTVTVKSQTDQTINGNASVSLASNNLRLYWSLGDRWGVEA